MSDTMTVAGRVLEALAEAGLVDSDQLAAIRAEGLSEAAAGKSLLERRLVTAAQLLQVLESDMGYPRVDLSGYAPDSDALQIVSGELARARNFLPLFEIEGTLTIAIGNPYEIFDIDAIGESLGYSMDAVIADPSAVQESIDLYYPSEPLQPQEMVALPGEEPEVSIGDFFDLVADSSEDEAGGEGGTQPLVETVPEVEEVTFVATEELIYDLVIDSVTEGEPVEAVEGDVEACVGLFAEIDAEAPAAENAPEQDAAAHGEAAPAGRDAEAAPAETESAAAETEAVPAELNAAAGDAAIGDPDTSDMPATEEPPSEKPAKRRSKRKAAAEPKEPGAEARIDLDVLAVADEQRAAVLVADILEAAIKRGANRIHLLPYKSDFFLVFRVGGRLERIASAPLSMQQALVSGFKSFMGLGSTEPGRPALGRKHAEIAGKSVVLNISAVPTVSGQRMVIAIMPVRPEPRSLEELGLPDAEAKALQAMVSRGRGLLLVAAPITGGRSTTYYSLLQQAAAAGRTVYSVERSIEYEIPAVAQVLASPGGAVSSAAYFAAGMQQDTDVMAIDAIQTAEDAHLAIEAAGMGKLVIATFAAAGIVQAVRRLLDLDVEPVSLASALTLGVGQRVLRTNCANCSVEVRSPLVDQIPGAQPGMIARKGTGCPNCGKSGYAGVTGIFEVLPFTESVRAVIARDGSLSEITSAARAAGMRPMMASGVALVHDGIVSPEELDRVLRYS